MDAMAFVACVEAFGTALYGVFDADWDGVIVPLGSVYIELGGDTLGSVPIELGGDALGSALSCPRGMSGVGTSSSSSSSDDSEVTSSSSSSSDSSSSLSLDDSVQVDGSYSCFSGEEERLLPLTPDCVGVKTGVLDDFKVFGVAGLGLR
jgi:hypothetical protein